MSQYLPIKEVIRRTGLCRSTIYDQMSKGEFPLSCQLTPRRVGWKEDEVEEWMKTRDRAAVKFGAHRGHRVLRRAAGEGGP